jgi:ATP-dependent DNA ligase
MSSELREFAAPKIEPCLSAAEEAPSGPGWPHEIKHDGFRMMIRRDAAGVRIITRNGRDWTSRFPLMASAANAIKAKDFLIDGEAVSRDDSGWPYSSASGTTGTMPACFCINLLSARS